MKMQKRIPSDLFYNKTISQMCKKDSADFEPIVLNNIESVIRATKEIKEYGYHEV